MNRATCLAGLLGLAQAFCLAQKSDIARVAELNRIRSQAPHNAFTDLIRFKDRWYCAFREGAAHVSPDGAIRVLSSPDGSRWHTAALLTSSIADLRDPKLSITGDNRLLLSTAGALHPPSGIRHQSMVWWSREGRDCFHFAQQTGAAHRSIDQRVGHAVEAVRA